MGDLMDRFRDALDAALGPWAKVFGIAYHAFLRPFVDSADRLFVPYVLCAGLVAIAVFHFAQKRRRPGQSLWSYLFPKDVWWSESARVDYGYFIATRVVSCFVKLGVIAVAMPIVATSTAKGLSALFGAHTPWGDESWSVGLSLAVSTFLLRDFGYFLGHYLLHRVPVLWEFHKAHHSALVMNPMTNYREHPVDGIVEGQVTAVLVGGATGLHSYLWGPDLVAMSVGLFVALEVGYSAVANLRHSHIWLSYGPWLSRIFSSPAMHQLHHSSEARHWDRNYGLMLSVWDWLFGCIYVPKEQEEFRLGLSTRDEQRYMSLYGMAIYPFIGAGKVLLRGLTGGTMLGTGFTGLRRKVATKTRDDVL